MELHPNQTLFDQSRDHPIMDKTPDDLRGLMFKKTPQSHSISTLYNSLFEDKTDFSNKACKAWEQDLDINLTQSDWETIYMNAHKGSLNVATQECGFKTITRWYRTPTLLHKFSPQISDRCWRCKQEEGSMAHIWWSCPLIQVSGKWYMKLLSQSHKPVF